MKLIERISPNNTPTYAKTKGDLFILREKILQTVLLVFALLGTPTIALAIIESVRAGEQQLVLIYLAVFGIFLLFLVLREIPYTVRGHTFTAVAYLLAISELFESGQMGDVRMFLITFVALTSVFFGYKNVIASVVLSLATIVGVSLYASTTTNPIVPAFANLNQGTDWITASFSFLLLSTIIAGSISIIISGLASNLKKQAEMSQHLESERDALEDRINERTQAMSRNLVQLRAASEITRAISALGDPETLLQQVIDLVKERFDLYYVGIFLLDTSRQYAVLQAGTGEPGKRMIAQGHQLAVSGSSMIGWSISNRKSRIALDVGSEAVRFNNPNLPNTRSEMAIPIIARDFVLGAMTVQSDQSGAFDENDIAILENIADSLGIALENDRLFHETRKSLDEIRTLNREYLQRAWAEALETYGELSYDFENQGLANTPPAENTHTVEVPLLLRDEVIGTIVLEMDRSSLSEDEVTFVDNVTTQTAIALENARLLHETERRAVQEQKLNEVATRFSRAQSIDEILRTAAQELGQLPTVAEVSVQLNPTGQGNRLIHSSEPNGSSNGKERSR